jgi:hypothetical protein
MESETTGVNFPRKKA